MTLYHEEAGDEPVPDSDGVPVSTLVNWAGAIISLLLMLGLAIWGYQLLVRDVSGVPVVRALEGPMRVAPEDPGGEQADYQGLSVTQVAVEGAEEAPTERVVLAPPPVLLEEEDLPVAALIPDEPSATPEDIEEAAAEPKSAIEVALAEALGQASLTSDTEAAPQGLAVQNTVIDQARVRVIPASIAGVAASPRPPSRPVSFQLIAAVSNTPIPSAPAGEVDPAAIPPGTRLVQLGAFPSEEDARAAWGTIEDSFGAYLDGKSRVVQEAAAGGVTFYRLRAMGFEDLSDARRFCAVLVAENANCIPVIRR
ncbi:MAG: SPOR domain-containing protein [Pseudomonadota bacterium]